ncbi:MAG: hypothetical protein Q8P67_25475, partial [archaeon]|nr:hypothetical protein [archaeon]
VGFCVGYGIEKNMPQHFVLAGLIVGLGVLLFFLYRWSQAPDVEGKFIFLVIGCLVLLLLACTAAQIYVWTTPNFSSCSKWASKNHYNLTDTKATTTTITTSLTSSVTVSTIPSTLPITKPCNSSSYNWTCALYFLDGSYPSNYSCCYPSCPISTPLLDLSSGTCTAKPTKAVVAKSVQRSGTSPLTIELEMAPSDQEDLPALIEALGSYADKLQNSLANPSSRRVAIV